MYKDKASIIDIDAAARRILKFCEGVTKAELLESEEKQSAVIYQLIIIGEATKRLSPDFCQ